jgi:hypothetical protein
MDAGRELDLIIAEKVMNNLSEQIRIIEFFDKDSDLRTIEFPDIPNYSTDIAMAWEIVNKLAPSSIGNGNGYNPQFTLSLDKETVDSKYWHAEFYDRWGTAKWTNPTCSSDGKSAPHAICLAALKTID